MNEKDKEKRTKKCTESKKYELNQSNEFNVKMSSSENKNKAPNHNDSVNSKDEIICSQRSSVNVATREFVSSMDSNKRKKLHDKLKKHLHEIDDFDY